MRANAPNAQVSTKAGQLQLHFMALLDGHRFAGKPHGRKKAEEVGSARDMMRRLSKEQLRTMDGRPLFPERRAYTVKYQLSEPEQLLYERVTAYVRDERTAPTATRPRAAGKRMAVGLALRRCNAAWPAHRRRSISRSCEPEQLLDISPAIMITSNKSTDLARESATGEA